MSKNKVLLGILGLALVLAFAVACGGGEPETTSGERLGGGAGPGQCDMR